MSRLLKWLGLVTAALVGVALLALVVLFSISDERYGRWTTEAVEAATGRSFSMDDFSLDLGSVIAVEARNVRLADAPWASNGDMVRVDRVELVVRLADLLRGRPAIEAHIGGAEANLVRNADGDANWQFAGDDGDGEDDDHREAAGGPDAVALIDAFVIENAHVTLDDAVSGDTRRFSIETLAVRAGEHVDVKLVAGAEGVPIALSGALGRTDQLSRAQPTPIELSGNAGDATLEVAGTWNPVVDPPTADIKLALDLPSDEAVVALTGLEPGTVDGGRIDLRLVAGDGQYALPTLDARLDGDRLTATIAGSIGRLSPPGDIELDVNARAVDPAELLRELGVTVAAALPATVELRGRLSGDGETVRVSDLALSTGEEGLSASASGTITFSGQARPELDIAFDATAPSSADLATYAGQTLPELGALNAVGKVVSTAEGVGLEGLVVSLGGRGVDLRVDGAITDVIAFAGASLETSGTIADLDEETADAIGAFARERGVSLPPALLAARLELKGRVEGGRDRLDLREVAATLRDENVTVDLAGQVDDLLGERAVSADVSGDVASLEALSRYIDVSLPDLGGLRAEGKLATTDDGIGFQTVTVELGGRGIDVRVEGVVASLAGFSGADLRASARVAELDEDLVEALSTLAAERGANLPPAVFSANAEVRGRIQGSLDKLDLGEASIELRDEGVTVDVDGSVADLLGEPVVNAQATAAVDSLATLSRYGGNDLPATDPLSMSASLGGGDNDGTPFKLDIAVGAIEATAEGDLGAVRSLDDMQLAFTATAESLADFSALAGRELPADGPFKLAGRFEADAGSYALNDFTLEIDEQSATGSLTVRPGDGDDAVGSIDGRLSIGRLDIGPLVGFNEAPGDTDAAEAPPAAPEAVPAQGGDDAAADGRYFSPEPLPFDLLRSYAGNVTVTADHMTLGKTRLSRFNALVVLENGRLTIDPLKSAVDRGSLTGRVVVDANRERPTARIFLDMKGAAMPRLGGNLELGIDVEGEGSSVAEIMAGLDGQVLAVVTGAELANSLLTSFGSDLLDSLNPLSKSKSTTTLECGIVRMDIEDGVARFDDQLAAQMTETTWRGGGEIDLETEKLDVGIVPKARKGLGISAGSLASLVQVTGTLAQPAVRPDPTGLAKNYGRYVAAMSTGGLSLLAEGIRDRLQANADVCADIREGTVFGLSEESGTKPAE